MVFVWLCMTLFTFALADLIFSKPLKVLGSMEHPNKLFILSPCRMAKICCEHIQTFAKAAFFCVWKTDASPTSKSSGTSFVLNPIEQFINWSPESMVQFNRNPLGYNGWDLMFVLGRFQFLSQTSLEHECQLNIKWLNRSQPPSTNFWHEPSGSNLLAQSSKILTLGFIRSPVYPAVWEESSK